MFLLTVTNKSSVTDTTVHKHKQFGYFSCSIHQDIWYFLLNNPEIFIYLFIDFNITEINYYDCSLASLEQHMQIQNDFLCQYFFTFNILSFLRYFCLVNILSIKIQKYLEGVSLWREFECPICGKLRTAGGQALVHVRQWFLANHPLTFHGSLVCNEQPLRVMQLRLASSHMWPSSRQKCTWGDCHVDRCGLCS